MQRAIPLRLHEGWRVPGKMRGACLVGQVSWRGLVGPVSVWQAGGMAAPREYGCWRLVVFLMGGDAARGAEGKIKGFSTKNAPTTSSGLFPKEANPRLANPPSSFSGGLAELGSTFLVEQATDSKGTWIVDHVWSCVKRTFDAVTKLKVIAILLRCCFNPLWPLRCNDLVSSVSDTPCCLWLVGWT